GRARTRQRHRPSRRAGQRSDPFRHFSDKPRARRGSWPKGRPCRVRGDQAPHPRSSPFGGSPDPMSRDPRLYLDDIAEAIDAIERYTAGVSQQTFLSTTMIEDAVIRRIEIIGEAARHLPRKLTDRHPEIPWIDVVGTRNRVVHEYHGVVLDRIWNTIQHDLPI